MALKLTVHFNCSTKVAYVKDDSTYSLPASVQKYVLGSLNFPSGLAVFSKTTTMDPLIGYNSIPRVSANYSLGGTIQAGNYTFSGTNHYHYNNSLADSEFLQFTANNKFAILGVDLTEALLPGTVIFLNNANDEANDGEFNVLSVEYDTISSSTKVTIVENTLVVTGTDEDATIVFDSEVVVASDVVYNYSTCSQTLCLELDFTYDAFSTQYGSATLADKTNYFGWTIENRNLQLFYPAGLEPAPEDNPISTNLSNISINVLATGIYTCKLVVTSSYIQNDGLVLDVTLTKINQATVIAYTEMCGIQECIQTMLDRHTAYLKSATVSPLQQYVDQVYGLYVMAKEALACGDKSTYSSYVSQIYTILGHTQDSCGTCSCAGSCDSCSDSCGCGQPDEPVWIDNLGIDVNSLLADFNDFMTYQLPELETTVNSLNTTVTDVVLPAIDALQTSVSTIGNQTTTNTGDISGLTDQVNNLDSEVTALQEQIATFSPSNSEVASNELFTNDGSNKLLYTSATGNPAAGNEQLQYVVNVIGDITSNLTSGDHIVFYSPADNAWYPTTVSSWTYKSGPGQTMMTLDVLTPTYWSSNSSSFPVFLAKPSTSIYNFTKQFQLHNDNYWKTDGDATHKYWAKLKTSFLWNSTNLGDDFLRLYNDMTSQQLMIRGIAPGSLIDLELTFEKVYNTTSSTYDLVYMLDIKSSFSWNKTTVDGALLEAGYTGYVPNENSDLYQKNTRTSSLTLSFDSSADGIYNQTQDVYNTIGSQNTNRIISRYAYGPSYPDNTNPQFFNGQGVESILFNTLNCNMTILNFEVSYGKMPA